MKRDLQAIQLMDAELSAKLSIDIQYVKVVCRCGNHWGVTVRDNKVNARGLLCERCLADEKIQEWKL